MKSLDILFENLNLIIDKNYMDSKMIKGLSNEFRKKGLKSRIPNLIFSQGMDLKQLSKIELMTLCDALHRDYKFRTVKIEDYFTDSERYNYITFMAEADIKVEQDTIILENCIENPNGGGYLACFVPLTTIASWEEEKLLRYNFETQREATYKKVGHSILKTQTLNMKSVEDITNMMCNNAFTANTITINILALENKEPQLSYDKENRRLVIKPDFSIDSPTTTFTDIIDGRHRQISAYYAVERMKNEGKLDNLNGSLHVSIQFFTIEEAKEYIRVQQMQNLFSTSYSRSLKMDDYMKFAKKMGQVENKEKNILYDNIANSYKEIMLFNKLTETTIIADALKLGNIKVGNPFEIKFKTKSLTEIITMMVDYIKQTKFNNNIELMRKTDYLQPHSFALYTLIAQEIVNEQDYFDKMIEICDQLMEEESDLKHLRLSNKGCSINVINRYLKENIL